jgi:DNA-binding transcriptional LysR family regulator
LGSLYEFGMGVEHLTLKQLRAVVAVYRTRQMSAAAHQLNVTQSAMSVLIRQCESALGIRLFDRTTRSVTPTRAGENAYGVAQRVLGDVETLIHTMHDLQDLQHGTVRVAATPATGMAMLPKTVQRYRIDHPGVALVLDDCAPNQFLADIREEKVEFGVGVPPGDDDAQFDSRLIFNDQLMLVCSADHPFAQMERVRWRELENQPLILSRRDYGVRDIVELSLLKLGIRAQVSAEIGFLSSASWLTACGLGHCVLPRQLAELRDFDGLAIRPLEEPVVTRAIAVVTKKGRSLSPASSAFVGYLMDDWEQPH